jgi:hypothetical protein
VPARQEAPERRLLGGLDLACAAPRARLAAAAAARRRRTTRARAARAQLAADEQLLALQLVENRFDVDAEALARLGGRERAAALRVAQTSARSGCSPASR